MLRVLLPIALSLISAQDDGQDRKPTEAELRRAHQMLAGSWEFVSITEKGEKLGPRIVGSRVARDNVLTIADRQFAIVNPETGEKRTATYRVNPAQNPRQIDLITSHDRIFRGIYKFDHENLILCLQPGDSRPRPADFSALTESDVMLIELTAVASPDRPAATRSPEPAREPAPSASSALLRGHEMLSGAWTIISIIDDGETLAPDLIKSKFAENGRVEIGTRNVVLTSPATGDRRVSALRIDPSRSPAEIDLTTRFDEVLRGIYRFEGDQLVLCMSKREDDDRPKEFQAPAGSNRVLFRLAMAPTKPAAAVAATPAAKPKPTTPAPAPAPALSDAERDAQIRQRMTGSWNYSDSKGRLTLVFRSDGSFTATRVWNSGLKRIFEGDSTTSNGRWSYSHGLLDAYITSTQDPRLLSRNYNYRVQSVGDGTLVVKNIFGELQTARRLR
jgi:uncharacterized protein (TIGR03067 family)